jgi:tetratricopeptide (TPR) repeat protein
MKSRIPIAAFLALSVAGLASVMMLIPRRSPVEPVANLDAARAALARGDHQSAERLACQAALGTDASPWALLVAAEAALKTNRVADALAYYQKVPRIVPEVCASADFGEAEMLCHLGRLSESEAKLRQLLVREPMHRLAHFRVAFILNVTGRRWEARPHLLYLVKNRAAEVEHLLLLGSPQRQVEDRALLNITARTYPDDPLPKLGAARLALTLNRLDEALPLLNDVLSKLPNEPEALVGKGRVLLEVGESELFLDWSKNPGADAERHPETWILRGTFAQRNHDPQVAARCFWEALRRDPENLAACHQLGRCLAETNDLERAHPFLERADRMQRLSLALDDLFFHRDHIESMRRAAILSRELGRLWEAASWSSIAYTQDPGQSWALAMLQEVSPRLHPDLPQTSPADDPAVTLDLSGTALAFSPSIASLSTSSRTARIHSQIRFVDQAPSAGIAFTYENAADDATPGARIFETTGGGVGVIDFDVDGWPDLYLTQGGSDPNPSGRSERNSSDQLFRNRMGDGFQNVTIAAQIEEREFSQGVAVGDFDNDGFPDFYVANFRQNRLFHNQGDGTFHEITESAGIAETDWTTSCLMADLNGDGFPDLYDVNYAAGEAVLTRICDKQGVTRSCSPRAFDPAPDRVWLNQGDGRFRDVTANCQADVPNGYGLGIVAFDIDGSGKLSLFIANDEVPNFLLVNTTRPTNDLRFEERALEAGVAVDADGRSQACMGVAAGDADGDGLTDLFVTNFYRESNTLYRQLSPGLFADVTRTSGLRDPSFEMLGFGTQFLDANRDGHEDLIVTNGHIDDLTALGEPYRMRTQFFLNRGAGTFQELPATTLGPFFEDTHLGRGLARLDWNRDGRDDFAVSHLREPASLLTNEAAEPGHFLCVSLRGTQQSRDAIGATVEVTTGNHHAVKQLTAGDGYHASNERVLNFGLGAASQIDSLSVRWPGGDVQEWTDIEADQRMLVIEGRTDLIRMH